MSKNAKFYQHKTLYQYGSNLAKPTCSKRTRLIKLSVQMSYIFFLCAHFVPTLLLHLLYVFSLMHPLYLATSVARISCVTWHLCSSCLGHLLHCSTRDMVCLIKLKFTNKRYFTIWVGALTVSICDIVFQELWAACWNQFPTKLLRTYTGVLSKLLTVWKIMAMLHNQFIHCSKVEK